MGKESQCCSVQPEGMRRKKSSSSLPESKDSQSTITPGETGGSLVLHRQKTCTSQTCVDHLCVLRYGRLVLETVENEIKWVPSWLHPDFSFVSRLSALRTREERN